MGEALNQMEAQQFSGPAIVHRFTTRPPDDWYSHPKSGEQNDLVFFARREGRCARQFSQDGNPSVTLLVGRAGLLELHLLTGACWIR